MSDTTAERTVAPKQLVALVRDASTKREQIAEIAGALGERVKNAVENGHLHRGAFALMVRFNKMDEQKRNDFIRAFGLYVDHCETALWGGKHTGDIVDLAEKRKAADTQAESAKYAGGIKELEPEKHAENQKPRRGRQPKADKAEKDAPEDPVEAAAERGRVDWLARKPGKIPEDLEGKPNEANAWLGAWEAGQIASSKARDAAEFDAAEPKKATSALPGAEAAGSYQTH